ncbi:MAG: helix-turn-helix transcriptional regulator [Pseudomonadota bacterium]
MDVRKIVGENFSRIRRAKGLTQEQVEELSGFSQQYISDLENGKRNPTIVSLYELAKVLGVSHVELVSPNGD